MKKVLLVFLFVSTSAFAHEPDPRPTPIVRPPSIVIIRHKDNRGPIAAAGALGLAVGVGIGISWDKGHSKVETKTEVSR